MVSALGINDQTPMRSDRNRLGQITTEQLSEKLARTYGYDEEGRLVHQRISSDNHQIERRFDYDLSGNLVAKQDSTKGTWRYSYDPMGRIIESIDPLDQVKQHAYDPAGDLLSHLPDTQDGLRTATYEGRTYRFDAAGNLVQREQNSEATKFAWDEQNRLRTVRTPDDTTTRMAYDALGRRCQKSVNGQRTFFAWDGDALLAEQFEDKPAREYVYYPNTFEPLAVIEGDGSVFYYNNDLNGLPQELTKPNGEIVWSATYDAMGRVDKILVDEIEQPLRFQGQYFDPEIDLCYNRHRYYDPAICSFISQDPLGLAAGENVFAYAPNVFSWIDPLGLSCKQTTNTWNDFQKANKGQFSSSKNASDAYWEIVNKESPWPLNHAPSSTTLNPGTTFEMALSPGQPVTRPGGFGTFDQITDVNYVRNDLAVKEAWKPQIDRVVTYEITKPLPANVGPVGPQVDKVAKKYLGGGGSQLEMTVPPPDRMNYLRVVDVQKI